MNGAKWKQIKPTTDKFNQTKINKCVKLTFELTEH